MNTIQYIMSNVWYELEIMLLEKTQNAAFYPIAMYNRSDENAGFDLHSAESVFVGSTSEFVPFGIVAKLIKVEQMPHGMSDDYLKTDSHFYLMPRSSIFKSGLIMANSVGVIDKGYRGELKAPVWSITGNSAVGYGDRLFQIVAPDMGWIRNIRLVESLTDTLRGERGFGSSGV